MLVVRVIKKSLMTVLVVATVVCHISHSAQCSHGSQFPGSIELPTPPIIEENNSINVNDDNDIIKRREDYQCVFSYCATPHFLTES